MNQPCVHFLQSFGICGDPRICGSNKLLQFIKLSCATYTHFHQSLTIFVCSWMSVATSLGKSPPFMVAKMPSFAIWFGKVGTGPLTKKMHASYSQTLAAYSAILIAYSNHLKLNATAHIFKQSTTSQLPRPTYSHPPSPGHHHISLSLSHSISSTHNILFINTFFGFYNQVSIQPFQASEVHVG